MSGTIIVATVAFGLSRGFKLDQLCTATNLSPSEIVDPRARVPDTSLLKLWELLVPSKQDGAIPIAMARAAPLTLFGGLAEGANFARNLEEALDLIVENPIVLADRLTLRIVQESEALELEIGHPLDREDDGLVSFVGSALLTRLLTEALGINGAIARVDLIWPYVENQMTLQDFFGAPVNFGCLSNRLGFSSNALDQPIDQACVELFSYVKEHFALIRADLESRIWPESLRVLRNSIISNAERNDYTAVSAAAGANMSLRSAQRLAAREGYSIQEMIDAVRLESAKYLLSDRSLRMDAIAFTLGYSDDRAFRRAFKRLAGESPQRYRASLDKES